MTIDTVLFNVINSYTAYDMAFLMVFISDVSMAVFAASVVPTIAKNRRAGMNYAAIIVTTILFSMFFQMVFQRSRPDGLLRATKENSFSFPSTHSSAAFAWAGFMANRYDRFWPVFYGFAFVVAVSRVYIGVHYPADVAAGAALGWAINKTILRAGTADSVFHTHRAKPPAAL